MHGACVWGGQPVYRLCISLSVCSVINTITCYLKRMENELIKISYPKIEVSAFSSKPNLTIKFGIYMMIKYILNGIKCCM